VRDASDANVKVGSLLDRIACGIELNASQHCGVLPFAGMVNDQKTLVQVDHPHGPVARAEGETIEIPEASNPDACDEYTTEQ
jgi:hypothetical protein